MSWDTAKQHSQYHGYAHANIKLTYEHAEFIKDQDMPMSDVIHKALSQMQSAQDDKSTAYLAALEYLFEKAKVDLPHFVKQ